MLGEEVVVRDKSACQFETTGVERAGSMLGYDHMMLVT